MFVTFEGIDGAGKSTQIDKLKIYLEENNIQYICTREPGGCEISEQIRDLILSTKSDLGSIGELFLYFAARAEHIRQVIKPALEAGKWVICDRFADSTFAYQGAGRQLNGNGLDISKMKEINNIAADGISPDLTILLDISVEKSLERRQARGKSADRLEQNDREFFENVRNSFLKLAKYEPKRFLVIDATLNENEIFEKIVERIDF